MIRCECRIRVEVNGTSIGPILYELPTLIYGYKNVWVMAQNETIASLVTDKYPNFYSTRKRKRSSLSDARDMQLCLKVFRNCPTDCERLSKIILGSNGLVKKFPVDNSAGEQIFKSLGQISCEKFGYEIPYPGSRIVTFFEPPAECGGETSTFVFPNRLCCSNMNLNGVGSFTFWNEKCATGVHLTDILGW